MNKNLRIFHSAFYIEGNAIHGKKLLTAYYGNCTIVCRRNNSEELDVAVAFCHHNDTFKKKEGIRIAFEHLEDGEYITIPVNRGVSGLELNDVVRSFLNRDTQADYRALCFGTTPNLPIRDWSFVEFTRRKIF